MGSVGPEFDSQRSHFFEVEWERGANSMSDHGPTNSAQRTLAPREFVTNAECHIGSDCGPTVFCGVTKT